LRLQPSAWRASFSASLRRPISIQRSGSSLDPKRPVERQSRPPAGRRGRRARASTTSERVAALRWYSRGGGGGGSGHAGRPRGGRSGWRRGAGLGRRAAPARGYGPRQRAAPDEQGEQARTGGSGARSVDDVVDHVLSLVSDTPRGEAPQPASPAAPCRAVRPPAPHRALQPGLVASPLENSIQRSSASSAGPARTKSTERPIASPRRAGRRSRGEAGDLVVVVARPDHAEELPVKPAKPAVARVGEVRSWRR